MFVMPVLMFAFKRLVLILCILVMVTEASFFVNPIISPLSLIPMRIIPPLVFAKATNVLAKILSGGRRC